MEKRRYYCTCVECGHPIYVGDEIFSISPDDIHRECLEDYFDSSKAIAGGASNV